MTITPAQKKQLEKIVKEMQKPGKGKKELIAGSGRYLAIGRLSLLKTQSHKRPLTDAVDLAMAFTGPPKDAIKMFPESNFSLKAAFGQGFVADVAGKYSSWIM